MRDERVIDYLLPIRIVDKSSNVQNESNLLSGEENQIFIHENRLMTINGKGYIVLDFGKELQGGIRILAGFLPGLSKQDKPNIRVRFGESLSETRSIVGKNGETNDHSTRDIEYFLPQLSDITLGSTGFRFVRIDFLLEEVTYNLKNIFAAFQYRDIPYVGSFKCENETINKIFNTARYTLHLNIQNNIWDGIKRDRLVWIGDMQPEVLGITNIWGRLKVVEDTIIKAEKNNVLPSWFGGLPTYSAWFIQIISDYYKKTKCDEFVKDRIEYIKAIANQYNKCICENGHIDYSKVGTIDEMCYFIDWPSSESSQEELEDGNRYLLLYVFNNAKDLISKFDRDYKVCDEIINKLKKKKGVDLTLKQIIAFKILTDENPKTEDYEKLINGGSKGFSTYMSYFILKAISKFNTKKAVELLIEYYGAMLNRGATSFWEDFHIEWLQNSSRIDEYPKEGEKDLHKDFGAYCYEGYRHSLCHGWSCGPIQFLMEDIAGINVIDDGCKKIVIDPKVSGLNNIDVDFPTPYGVLNVKIEEDMITINKLNGVEVIVNK